MNYANEAAMPREMTLTERLSNDLGELIGMLSEASSTLEETFSSKFGSRLKDQAAGANGPQLTAVPSYSEADILDKLTTLRSQALALGDLSRDFRRRL